MEFNLFIKRFFAFAIGTFTLLFAVTVFSKTNELSVQKDIDPLGLKKNQGIVLIQLDVDGVAPSIEISSTNLSKKLISGITNQHYILQLRRLGKGAYLIELPVGNYQITKVNAPFYNLPFYIQTEDKPSWAFSVYPNVINYIGELSIAKERSSNLIDVNFYHRVATYLPKFEQEFGHLFKQYPLKLSFAKQDDFLQELNK